MNKRLPANTKTGNEHKSLPVLYQKVLDEDQGIVEELFAVFGNIDHGADRIMPGAFAKTIAERGGQVLVLDNHKTDSVLSIVGKPIRIREVGKGELPIEVRQRFPDASGGVVAETQYLLDTPEGKGVFDRIKSGAVKERSFGYDALDKDYEQVKAVKTDDGWQLDPKGETVRIRNLRTVKLYEYSPVLWGMNPATATLSAKAVAEQGEDFYSAMQAAIGGVEGVTEWQKAIMSVNLTALLSDVAYAFYSEYGTAYGDCEYYIRDVYDDYLVVQQYEGGFFTSKVSYYKVPYSTDGDEFVFAERSTWIEGEYLFVPSGEGDGEQMGRDVTSTLQVDANDLILRQLIGDLSGRLDRLEKSLAVKQGGEEKTDDAQAGPNDESPSPTPSFDDEKRRKVAQQLDILIHQAEVQSGLQR